jgi:PadR family transcriptional regulator, regulatory protein PadR
MKDQSCEMKGFLTFLTLWLVSRKPITGSELGSEIEKRKGHRPSPGTIYPVLKELKNKGLIDSDIKKKYTITKKGMKELDNELRSFLSIFCDMDEMQSCCSYKR